MLALGWANDPRESEGWARQLFGLIDEALAPLAGQVRPRYLALHWAADPTVNVERTLGTATPAQLLDLARWQIPRSPEEGAELDVLRSQLVLAETQPSVLDTARLALAFWLTIAAGERCGRARRP